MLSSNKTQPVSAQPWELPGMVGAAVPYRRGAPAPAMWFQNPGWGWVGWWPRGRSCLCRPASSPAAVLPCGWMVKLVGSPMDRLSLVTARAFVCEGGFSLFSHLQARAGSLPCDTLSFRGEEMAFEQHRALAPVAWIRNLHAVWWMLLLLRQISGWMFH